MDEQKTTGTLYIVATPIGNSRDMSERGREILSTADIIAAEDTRRSVVLLNKLGIRGNSLSANHKFNEYGKAKWFIEQLASGKDIAVPCASSSARGGGRPSRAGKSHRRKRSRGQSPRSIAR